MDVVVVGRVGGVDTSWEVDVVNGVGVSGSCVVLGSDVGFVGLGVGVVTVLVGESVL